MLLAAGAISCGPFLRSITVFSSWYIEFLSYNEYMGIVKKIIKFGAIFLLSAFFIFSAYIYIAANILANTLAD